MLKTLELAGMEQVLSTKLLFVEYSLAGPKLVGQTSLAIAAGTNFTKPNTMISWGPEVVAS